MTPDKIRGIMDMYEHHLEQCDAAQPISLHLRHVLGMCAKVRGFLDEGRWDKANRWLGFIQGVLWVEEVFEIEDMKNHNRSDNE